MTQSCCAGCALVHACASTQCSSDWPLSERGGKGVSQQVCSNVLLSSSRVRMLVSMPLFASVLVISAAVVDRMRLPPRTLASQLKCHR